MSKDSHNIPLSAYVLDLSSAPKSGSGGNAGGNPAGNSVSAKARKKTARISIRSAIAAFSLVAILVAAGFGAVFYEKFRALKATAFGASAMSEEGIASIEKFLEVIQYLPAAGPAGKIKELAADFESFKNILGFDRPKKYLLVFQNPAEVRATGGFIGSVGVLEIESGKIKSVNLKDVYGLDGQLKISVEPPGPVKKISAAWSLHDSNWFFDFPTSAEKISWFYEKGGGETMDGVIAFNPKVVEDVLKVAGPVKIEKYGEEVTEKNFVETAQNQVEAGYDRTINQPKMFLAEFLGELNRIVNGLPLDKKIIIMKNLVTNLDGKDIQVVFRNEGAQSFVESHNWDGRVKKTDEDYLAVVSSNINGFKTDAVTDETIDLVTEITGDGAVTNNLIVSHAHNGLAGGADWYNKVNSDYLRIFVPEDSELLAAEGMTKEIPFLKDSAADYNEYLRDSDLEAIEKTKTIDERSGAEIFKESGKTVFGSWVYVSPGERATASWQYRLPFRVKFDDATHTGVYSLLFQKQSGSRTKKISQKIIFPAAWKVIGNYQGDFVLKSGQIERTLDIKSDRFAPILFSNTPQ